MNELLHKIPASEGVRKIGLGEGETFDVAGAHILWKVRAEDSAYSFTVNELTLGPAESVPVHSHTSAECFYVLTGEVSFFHIEEGKESWIRATAGEMLLLPPNSLHGFHNVGRSVCRLLGVSTAAHQAFFDAVLRAENKSSFAAMAPPEAMGTIGAIAIENNMYFPPVTVEPPREE